MKGIVLSGGSGTRLYPITNTATIYTVSIVSPGVTIEEEHIAREKLNL